MNVDEVTEAYDANNDGLLAMDEMQSMMMELRGKMGSQQGGTESMQSLLATYQSDPEKDPASILMEMFGENTEDEEEYFPVNIQV